MEKLQFELMPVYVNSMRVSGKMASTVEEALRKELDVNPVENFKAILSLTEKDFVVTGGTPELEIDFKGGLTRFGEHEFQKGPLKDTFFDIKWARAYDLSTSNSSISGPFFKPAQSVGDASVAHLSAKPDATSLAAPMDLEIKSDQSSGPLANVDWEVLDQAVERVLMRLRMAGFLSYAAAFAVTGRSAWCVVGTREFGSQAGARGRTREFQNLYVRRIKHANVSQLWGAVTRSVTREPCPFLTADGPLLLRSLRAAGLAPWACRVKWIASSMSNVYGITPPERFELGKTTCRGVDCRPESIKLVVKVVRGDTVDLFAREVFALKKMAAASSDSAFYALGHFPDKDSMNPGGSFTCVRVFFALFLRSISICMYIPRPLRIHTPHPFFVKVWYGTAMHRSTGCRSLPHQRG